MPLSDNSRYPESEMLDEQVSAFGKCRIALNDRGWVTFSTYLSHTASFHSAERIAPSNRWIKQLDPCSLNRTEMRKFSSNAAFAGRQRCHCTIR